MGRATCWSGGRGALHGGPRSLRPDRPASLDPALDDGGASSGASVALLDDSDGDGVDEVVVGTCDWWWHGPVLRTGRLRCFSGASGKPLWEIGVDDVSIPETAGR